MGSQRQREEGGACAGMDVFRGETGELGVLLDRGGVSKRVWRARPGVGVGGKLGCGKEICWAERVELGRVQEDVGRVRGRGRPRADWATCWAEREKKGKEKGWAASV